MQDERGSRVGSLFQAFTCCDGASGSGCRCLDVGPRSRYLHLAWAKWEQERGNTVNARMLLERGHSLNPRDGAILQVRCLSCISLRLL